ncbi:MarR family winged helix-turn-helix transcriptional regulator [Leeia aquatica]|uniref:MarR family transcriptional regulator n=1 Tax=Leeia aquatica TaxID=2725557 RepID=A0A847S4T2_9NEIS|nr:MarR family transcriptional regulator [Leeia aquatica]NLR73785.1 MarR family transcriptional regulator [Leeia aquatica]
MVTDSSVVARQIGELYHQLYLHLHVRWQPGESRPGPEALAMMQHLHVTGPLTIGEIVQHLQRAQSAISEQVMRLEQQGWLTRFADQRDRRRTLVWLSEAGLAVLHKAQRPLDADLMAASLQQLSTVEQQQLIALLQRWLAAAIPLNHWSPDHE